MFIAKELVRSKNVVVHGLDVIDMKLTNLPLTIFDGTGVPFGDKCYDISLLIGVLHHVNDQEKLLKEVARVTSLKIILFEDIYRSRVGENWVKLRDIIGNLPEEPKMNFALNFRSENEWERFFDEFSFEVQYKNTMFNPIRLTHHALFILKPG